MNSITEIIHIASPEYMEYFARKTGFLLSSGFGKSEQTRWLWKHIIRNYDFKSAYQTLNFKERSVMRLLLNNFGRLPFADDTGFVLEKKVSWVFRHPAGGIFIPLEIIKLLMQEEYFQKKNYLFSLLYKLKLKEQNILASFTGNSLEGQVAISFEKNPLDMGLVLYIWFSAKIRTMNDINFLIPRKGKVLKGPYSFTREEQGPLRKKEVALDYVLPETPVNLWDYLMQNFPHLKTDTEKVYTLMADGKKGFYRALNLLNNPENEYLSLFRHGLLFPVLSAAKNDLSRVKKTKVVAPSEVRYHYRDTLKSKNKSEKKL